MYFIGISRLKFVTLKEYLKNKPEVEVVEKI